MGLMRAGRGRRPPKAIWLMAILALGASPMDAQGPNGFALRDGDRVVFYGDSITDNRHYSSLVETYVVTRFPKLKITFVHSGWGGDGVGGGAGGPIDTRLARDVLAYEPTVLTIMLGMNDGGTRPFDPALFEVYEAGYRHIVETVRRTLPAIRITLLQPSPYDDVTRAPDFEGGYNAVLIRYGAFVRELADSQKMTVADLNAPVVAALKRAYASDPAAAAKLISDRIHPGPPVALVLAQALLQAWNAPAVVAEVEIDAASKSATVQVNTRVSDVRGADGVSWTQSDEALPMPLETADPLVALVLRSSDFMASVNRQPLRVKGLTPGRYALRIDGHAVGTFDSDRLSTGIDLAELPTPMAQQAADVHALTIEHTALHWMRWRRIQFPLERYPSPELTEAVRALDALEATVVNRQRAAAQPRPRRFELEPAPPAHAPASP
jgi:lysophospholipase L1-like esterase